MAPLGKGLQLDFGKFVTPAGAEVIETNQNWNYTRSLLFYYAIPYYHFGARAKYTFNDKWSVTGYGTNGWNNVVSQQLRQNRRLQPQPGTRPRRSPSQKPSWSVLGIFASERITTSWNNLSDTVLAYNPSAKLSLQANLDYDRQETSARPLAPMTADYTGIAGYVKYAFNPKVAVAGRYEYLNDHDGLALAQWRS